MCNFLYVIYSVYVYIIFSYPGMITFHALKAGNLQCRGNANVLLIHFVGGLIGNGLLFRVFFSQKKTKQPLDKSLDIINHSNVILKLLAVILRVMISLSINAKFVPHYKES